MNRGSAVHYPPSQCTHLFNDLINNKNYEWTNKGSAACYLPSQCTHSFNDLINNKNYERMNRGSAVCSLPSPVGTLSVATPVGDMAGKVGFCFRRGCPPEGGGHRTAKHLFGCCPNWWLVPISSSVPFCELNNGLNDTPPWKLC